MNADRLLTLAPPVVIAHRGGSALRPENTIAAFDHAARLGVDAFECDVHLSGDNDVVVIHDETLDRTTDARGAVSALSADELSRVDAAYHFGEREGYPHRGTGIGVPRLASVLTRFPDVPLIIEVKGDNPATAMRAMEVVRAAQAEHRVVIGGFSHAVIGAVRAAYPGVITSASVREVESALRRAFFRLRPRATGMRLFQVPVRLRGRRVLTHAFVTAARRANLPVQAWIVDRPDEMRTLLAWGVTGLISDRPDLAKHEIQRFLAERTDNA